MFNIAKLITKSPTTHCHEYLTRFEITKNTKSCESSQKNINNYGLINGSLMINHCN